MGKKILLADDSITIQRVIELTFSDEDFDVVTVGNGRLAIERIQEVRPDVVLCDIIMPEKDGYEVCEFVKGNPAFAHIPVLLLTGAFEPFDQDRANRVGSDGFLAKPFEPQTLIARVRELLSRAPQAAPVAAPAAPRPVPPPVAPSAAPAPTPRPAPPAAPPIPAPTRPSPAIPPPPLPRAAAAPVPRPPVMPAGMPPLPPPPTPVPWAARPAVPAPPVAPEPTAPPDEVSFIPDEPFDSAATQVFAPATGETMVASPDGASYEPELYPAQEIYPPAEAYAPEAESTPGDFLTMPADEDFEAQPLQPEPVAEAPVPLAAEEAEFEPAMELEPEPEAPPAAWAQPTVEVSWEARAKAAAASAAPDRGAVFEEVFEPSPSPTRPVSSGPVEAVYSEDVFEPVAQEGEAPPEPPSISYLLEPQAPEPPPPAPEYKTPVPPARAVPAAPLTAEASFSGIAPPAVAPAPSIASEVPVPVDMVAQIAQRVVGQMSEKILREVAWEVVPDLAEALIKKEIERLKAELDKH
jgi:CheY-like chemotaxis protein